MLHDVQRQDEHRDIQHGGRAADFAASLMGDWVHLNSTQMYQLTEACRYHSMGRLSKDVTIQTCWDADRLDLGRVGERPNPTYLGTKAARDPKFIQAAIHRSKNRFANYLFLELSSNACSWTKSSPEPVKKAHSPFGVIDAFTSSHSVSIFRTCLPVNWAKSITVRGYRWVVRTIPSGVNLRSVHGRSRPLNWAFSCEIRMKKLSKQKAL